MTTPASHFLGLKLGPSDGGAAGPLASAAAAATVIDTERNRGSRGGSGAASPRKTDRGDGRERRRKELVGYAAVAALRQQQPRPMPEPARMWNCPGERPSTQPVGRPRRPVDGRLFGRPSTANCPDKRRACNVCILDSFGASAGGGVGVEEMEMRGGGNEAVGKKRRPPSMLVFSGGTAFNGVVEELKNLTTNVTHVLPVSDDGGSTAEILRVLGGPAVGDVRSRCLRLSDESTAEAAAVKRLLGYRLSLDATAAKLEWYKIVEGEHELWNDVSGPYRETIRAFLVFFQTQILLHAVEKFSFTNGSIGNFFFAGARLFFQSLDAAIFLFSRVSGIPPDSLVLPVICTNERLILGCKLYDGTLLRGQNEISHPIRRDFPEQTEYETLVDKSGKSAPPLSSPIKRVFYTSTDGTNASHEVFPSVNTRVLERLGQVDAIVYGMGSLYTSICPLLVLHGVGETVAKQRCPKILLLNGTHDRETAGMSASDFITSICNALNRKYGNSRTILDNPPTAYVNVVLVPANGGVPVDTKKLASLGVTKVVVVNSIQDVNVGTVFDPKALIASLGQVIAGFLKN